MRSRPRQPRQAGSYALETPFGQVSLGAVLHRNEVARNWTAFLAANVLQIRHEWGAGVQFLLFASSSRRIFSNASPEQKPLSTQRRSIACSVLATIGPAVRPRSISAPPLIGSPGDSQRVSPAASFGRSARSRRSTAQSRPRK